MDRRGFLATATMVAVAGCSTSEIEDLANQDDQGADNGNTNPDDTGNTNNGGGGTEGPQNTGSDSTDDGGTESTGGNTEGPDDGEATTEEQDDGWTNETDQNGGGNEASVSASDYPSPEAVTAAFYEALINRNIERANAFAHPNQPGLSGFPVDESDAPPEGSSVTSTVLVDREDGVASVSVDIEGPNGRPLTEQIGVHTHEDGWLVWRLDNCVPVSC